MKATNQTKRKVYFDLFQCPQCKGFYAAPSPTDTENDETPDEEANLKCDDCFKDLFPIFSRGPLLPEDNPFNDAFVSSDERIQRMEYPESVLRNSKNFKEI